MADQNTPVTSTAPMKPIPTSGTPAPAGVKAPERPIADTGGVPKPLTPTAPALPPTNPAAATQVPKTPLQQTVPPAPGKSRKPRSGRSH